MLATSIPKHRDITVIHEYECAGPTWSDRNRCRRESHVGRDGDLSVREKQVAEQQRGERC